mmetsp:Transcript_2829/g.5394  ORF Transcript_2829/g.5394 Transcript_2829/m.5394 type:complete len:306 (-) Transcript_2829:258-1175(-)
MDLTKITMALVGENDMEKLKALSAKTYSEQAVWFMNCYWGDFFENKEAKCEEIWKWTSIFIDLDKKGKKGCELNEFDAHRFLEKINETLSVKDMREFLRSVDIDFNKMVSLTEYLVSKYKVQWNVLVNKPQNTDKKAMQEREDAKAAVEEAKAKADVAMTDRKAAEAAEAEVKAALAKVRAEEKKYKDKMAKLEQESNDDTSGTVKRNKAKNMLAQLKAKPTLSLQRAKITLTAAEKKAAKATKKAVAAYEAAVKAFADAEAKLNELLKKEPAGCHGSDWWLKREFEEAKKYMPKSKLAKLAGKK